MKHFQIKKTQHKTLAMAFAMPSIGMLLVMFLDQCIPFGNESLFFWDTYHQYYPFFLEFRNALREGKSLLYTWNIGLGMDYLGMIGYYLASPLNLLGVLVPENLLLEYFALMVPIKLGFAGLFFAILLEALCDKDDISISFFACFYGLCAWVQGYQGHIMWLDSFAVFPLVVLGTVKLLKERKFILYTTTLFLSFFCNYYIGLFTCYFVFLLFFVYEYCLWDSWKKFRQDFLRIALFSVLAIGMTAILVLPALSALQAGYANANSFPKGFLLNIAEENTWNGLLDAIRQVAGNMGGFKEPTTMFGLPNIYCGVVSVFLIGLYFTSSKIPMRNRICAALLLLFLSASFIISQLDYIWHGFHYTMAMPYRFSFIFSFVVLYMAYRAWIYWETFSAKQILLACIWAAAIFACSDKLVSTTWLNLGIIHLEVPLYFLGNFVLLALYALIMLLGSIRKKMSVETVTEQNVIAEATIHHHHNVYTKLLLVVMGIELIANLACFDLFFMGNNVSDYPKETKNTASAVHYIKEQERQNLFYRVETTHSHILNDAALNGYNGISAYTSTANRRTSLFMQALGYGAKSTFNFYTFEESSPVANLFLGLKYMIDRDGWDRTSTFFEETYHSGNVSLLENRAYLPLAFLANLELASVNFDITDDPFLLQNEMFTAATAIEKNVWYQVPYEDFTIVTEDVTIMEQNENGCCNYNVTERDGSITYRFVARQDGFLCLHLNLLQQNDYSVSVNGVKQYTEALGLPAFMIVVPQMIAVDDVTAGDVIDVQIDCCAGENSAMTVCAAILDSDVYWQGYETLNRSTLELTAFENTFVEGVINCDRDGLLYASIPQDGNWTVQVDGKTADTLLIGNCMIGVGLEEGSHMVSFIYHNPAFSLGWKISLVCAIVFILLVYLFYKPTDSRFKS